MLYALQNKTKLIRIQAYRSYLNSCSQALLPTQVDKLESTIVNNMYSKFMLLPTKSTYESTSHF